MALRFLSGDIFAFGPETLDNIDPGPNQQRVALAHGVNCRGLMGAGVAAQFAARYPLMEETYAAMCHAHTGLQGPEHLGGKIYTYITPNLSPKLPVWVIFNMFTQVNPGPDARIGLIEESFERALHEADDMQMTHLRMPLIGAGIGGLAAEDVIYSLYSVWSWTKPKVNVDVVTEYVAGQVPR
jgi:O-acetyl-ADP-ribose deacetylase (regulator of RNase III)